MPIPIWKIDTTAGPINTIPQAQSVSTNKSQSAIYLLRKTLHATLNHVDNEMLNRDGTELILILVTIFKEELIGLFIGITIY